MMEDKSESPGPWDAAFLLKLAKARMPFGKYAGSLLIDLPRPMSYGSLARAIPKAR